MKLKRFNEINEANQNDIENLKNLSIEIRKTIPTFDVQIQGNQGIILIDGITRFHTYGHESFSVIYAYVSGLYTGLKQKI